MYNYYINIFKYFINYYINNLLIMTSTSFELGFEFLVI